MKSIRKVLATATCVAAVSAGVFAQKIQITGAGATFPAPIYTKWFFEYNKLHPNVEINYQSIGSGAGIRQVTSQTVFFGATDGPMTNDQLTSAPGKILHFPTVLGGVVPVYNIPLNADLKFTGHLLADIYLGRITKWNDPAIAKLNGGVNLPGSDITVVHRADSSGTTYIWVDYLSKVSPDFKSKVGVATAVNWPVGLGGKGNEGVSGTVTQTPGSIGYVELIYALQNKLGIGWVKNQAGKFAEPKLETVTNAAAGIGDKIPPDLRASIVNAPGDGAYPISGFTWLLGYKNMTDKAKAQALTRLMWWSIYDGQKFCADLGYAPLPEAIQGKSAEKILSINVNDQRALPSA